MHDVSNSLSILEATGVFIDFPFPPPECAQILYVDVAFRHPSEVYDEAFAHILEVEGTTYESTGVSKFGITAPTLAKYRARNYPRSHRAPKVTPSDVKRLTKSEAKALYRTLFWENLRINEIRSKAVAIAVFNQTIHRSEVSGILFLQKSMNDFAKRKAVTVTGVMTDETLRVLNEFDEKEFLKFFAKSIDHNYVSIVRHNPRQRQYLDGWRNRASAIAALGENE